MSVRGKIGRVHCRLEERLTFPLFPVQYQPEPIRVEKATRAGIPGDREMLTATLEQAQTGSWLPQEIQARRDNLRKGQNTFQSQWTD